jgi:NAD(P)-dependent dehydrogenase (short-subunit alcohol dehydrogenase family)
MVNAGLEGFVRAAAMDLPEGPRVNVVSPPLVRETALELGMGAVGMSAAQVAQSYVTAVDGGGPE